MSTSFPVVMIAMMALAAVGTVWLIKKVVQPPTDAGKKRLTIILRFVVAEFAIITVLALLSVEHLIHPQLFGILALVNFVGGILIFIVAIKRAPITD